MGSDLFLIFYWWLMLVGIGVVFLPLTFGFFGKFFDRGYAFSKIIGILIITYVIWLLGSLKILPFLTETIWLVILGAVAGNYWLYKKRPEEIKREIQKNWRLFVAEEVLFFLTLTFWSFVRGFQPDITGLEKFMDYGFVNSILRNSWFPPADMWLAGQTINYYYFGHLLAAVLTRLSAIDSAITYNLLMATLFGLCFTASFSLGANLITKARGKAVALNKTTIIGGLVTALLLNLGGNLHPLWWLLKHGSFLNYWYPDATRFIVELFGAADNTIHEFPIYSYVVADLHGHLINLPFVILFLALMLVLITSKKISFYYYFLISLLLACFYMTNTWDFAIYLLVFGLVVLYFNYLKSKFKMKTITQSLLIGVGCLFLALIFSLPFHLHFKSISTGIGLTDFHSPPGMLLVLWGFPLFIGICYLLFLIVKRRYSGHRLQATDFFLLFLIGISWFLIIFPEFFYVKDIYIHSYQRANTMFKLTYQSFVMFSFVGGFVIWRILSQLRGLKKLLSSLVLIAFFYFLFRYPIFAIRSYYGLTNYRGLYGLEFLKNSYPDDYQAVLWMRKNITGQEVVVEAVGESYTDFARVSAMTGLPTILGWRVHEWLWRGSFDEPGKRTEEVTEIYESTDLGRTKNLLNQYRVKYIFLGDLERKQYVKLQEQKLESLGEPVFVSGNTKVYQLKD